MWFSKIKNHASQKSDFWFLKSDFWFLKLDFFKAYIRYMCLNRYKSDLTFGEVDFFSNFGKERWFNKILKNLKSKIMLTSVSVYGHWS